MARLYLFAVGGTGARVLKAFTYLMAAGVPLRDERGQPMELVPLVLDPDAENGDTLQCLSALNAYTDFRTRHLNRDYSGSYFSTRVWRYQDLQTAPTVDDAERAPVPLEQESFRCGVVDRARSQTFAEAIGYEHMAVAPGLESTRLLVEGLFSAENLGTQLSGGFLGNPNIGTVVLNGVRHSREFRMLPGLFHADDKIFIISSIFGGTGAAGFPVLVKLFRDARDEKGKDIPALRTANIGALTVLPYFGLNDRDDSPIDSNIFIPKTKAALSYYKDHLGELQCLYYIGDRARKQYTNAPTGRDQRNPDHLIELMGAAAIFHFTCQAKRAPLDGACLECAIEPDPDNPHALTLANLGLGSNTHGIVAQALTEFAMATRFLDRSVDGDLGLLLAQPWTKEAQFDRAFFTGSDHSTPFGAWRAISRAWWASLTQMANNEPSFRPFGADLASLRADAPAQLSTDTLNVAMNQLRGGELGAPRSMTRLLQMLSAATRKAYEERYAPLAVS